MANAPVREIWLGLTPRGRGLIGLGLLCCAQGWLIGHPSLLPVGALLLALPALGYGLARRSRFRLAAARSAVPNRVPLGEPVQVTIELTNLGRFASGLLLLEDAVPGDLGVGRRFVVDAIAAQEQRRVTYQLRPASRGRRKIGPLRVRVVDAFGLVSLERSFSATDEIVVQPRVEELMVTRRGGLWAAGGEQSGVSVVAAGADDIIPREYRTGDELRRVHWPATARYGQLMVRREEQPWRSRVTIALDCRITAHRGTGPESSFEWAVSAAASIGIALLQQGFVLDVVDHGGRQLVHEIGLATSARAVLLDGLAEISPSTSGSKWAPQRPGAGACIVVLGDVDRDAADALRRWRSSQGRSLALVAPGAKPALAELSELARSAWRISVAPAGASVTTGWANLTSRAGAA